MGKRSDPAAARKEVLRIEDMDRAIELRRDGKSIRAIAALMGVSRSQAALLVDEGLRAIPRENAEALRKVALEQLDQLWEGISKPAQYDDKGRLISGGATEGEPQAIAAAVKIVERRARLLGLDAPTKLDAKVTGKSLKDMTDAEVLALHEELKGRTA